MDATKTQIGHERRLRAPGAPRPVGSSRAYTPCGNTDTALQTANISTASLAPVFFLRPRLDPAGPIVSPNEISIPRRRNISRAAAECHDASVFSEQSAGSVVVSERHQEHSIDAHRAGIIARLIFGNIARLIFGHHRALDFWRQT